MKASCPCLLGLVLLLLAGCGSKESPPASSSTNTARGNNPLSAPADYVGAVVQSQRQAVKVTELATLKQAIQMFHAAEDRYPKDLEELVRTQYLPALPKLPTGMKLEYRADSGEVRIVSSP